MKTQTTLIVTMMLFAQFAVSQSWHHIGPSPQGPVYTIVHHGDDVYVGGAFLNVGGNPDADYLARWDGCEWHAVGPGLNGPVWSIGLSENAIYVGGAFNNVDGNPDISLIAYWDGLQWNGLGSGVDYSVIDIVIIDSDVYVGGGFNVAGDVPETCLVARWDGDAWHSMGSGPSICAYDFAYISDMATDGTNLYVTGLFFDMDGKADADRVARWDGTSWHSLGSGIGTEPLWSDDLHIVVEDYDVYVSGAFTDAGGNPDADYIVRWDGIAWSGLPVTPADSFASVLFKHNDLLYCDFPSAGEVRTWDNNTESWETFVSTSQVNIIAADSNNLYAGGFFMQIDGDVFVSIARYGEDVDCSTSGIADKKREPLAIEIFPNPTQDIVTYTFDEHGSPIHTVILTDATGKVILDVETQEQTLDISHLPVGVYLLHITTEQFKGTCRIVKN